MNSRKLGHTSTRYYMVSLLLLFAFTASSAAVGSINMALNGPPIGNATNFEDFESFSNLSSPGEPLVSSGFRFDCGCSFVIWDLADLHIGSKGLYQNGGSDFMTTIELDSGNNFQAISMVLGNGLYTANPSNFWVRAYNNGSPVESFVLNSISLPATISLTADGVSQFDEVRIQSYGADAVQESESQRGAIVFDDVTAGEIAAETTPVPATGKFGLATLALLLALFGANFVRRERQFS